MNLQIGQFAPDFSLPDQDGKIHKLSDYRGKWVLVYFYPQDDTPGCTTEACGFRDNLPRFEESQVIILGISTDTVESHRKFADKYGLPFTLLADSDRKIVQEYGVWDNRTLRTSFLINPEGKIIKIYEKVNPDIHSQQVLQDFVELIK